ncbi:MAG TPA: PA14 domain-containing protein [Anaerolineae bacterium]|mgnify:FL=1|nr:MAG: N-acetylmuramoyl-L-alanine amidase sle1 precursor [Chloroflexi bacterium ADurb.Bin222]HOC21441.1 PA14 domain-containing protein [Anaerolineae bacterium]HQM14167.1 PA14 domain-containing protein [Anaerolineae bacterium]
MRRLCGLLILAVLVSWIPLLVMTETVSAACGGTIHVVQPGENLYRIALKYGVTMAAISQANGITNPNHIYVGQRLIIPTGSACPPPVPPPPPPAGCLVHVVKPGENLTLIAARYGVSAWALAQVNGIYNTNLLYVGQRLTIPCTPAPVPGPVPTPAPVPSGAWRGEYFRGTTPAGGPLFVKNSATLNFHWGLGTPDSRLASDGFSARWARTYTFRGGLYRLTLTVDDGARVWVDDALVLDAWKVQPETTYVIDVPIAAGKHTFTVEYFEDTGVATLQFTFKWVGAVPPEPTPLPGEADWQAWYFANKDLADPAVLAPRQAKIDFNWGVGSPAHELPADNFSARWLRNASFASGTYAFCVRADDGVRLWVDNVLVLDEWHLSNGDLTLCRDYPLGYGLHAVRVEYFEATGNALIKAWWTKR